MSNTFSDTIYKIQDICLTGNIPFVTYSLPAQKDIFTLVQYKSAPRKIKNLEEINKRQGFVVAPFYEEPEYPIYFLEPDLRICGRDVDEKYVSELRNAAVASKSDDNLEDYYVAGKDEFMDQVHKITETIKQGNIDKVVLSRIQLIENNTKIGALEVFYALCEKYPRAFKYIFNLPGTGCWVGATPEPLVEIHDKMVETVSLAGTQKLNGIPIENVQWMAKELEEQKFVTDFIEERLNRFGITDYSKQGPVNQPAANLVHLKSVFTFNSEVLKGKTGEFISVLHPTPSVCGLPRRRAYDYLKRLEKHKREYYTGFLGTVNMEDTTRVFVNLRCMKVLENHFALFMGAGITSGSNPESEWDETNQKMMTMLNVINSLTNS